MNKLTVEGELDVTGPMVVAGTLSLPAGIINNDALANPVSPGQFGGALGGFGVTGTLSATASGTIAVPAGFSTALVIAIAEVSAYNSTTATDYLYVGAQIGTTTPALPFSIVGPSNWAHAAGSASRTLTGLSGGSIAVAAVTRSNGANWGANAANFAVIDAIAIFLR